MIINLIKNTSRGHANYSWLDTYYSYSFANYYNPERMGFGPLRVLNDDTIAPGQGFPMHSHRDMEIITIILEGELEHKDSLGNVGQIKEGEIQIMSAGTGITHSEYNSNRTQATNLLQIWLQPNIVGIPARYDQHSYLTEDDGITTLISSTSTTETPLQINQDAYISMGVFEQDKQVEYTPKTKNKLIKIFVIKGQLSIDYKLARTKDAFEIEEAEILTLKVKSGTKFILFDM